MTHRAVLYARFSSDLQRDASIEDQLRSCRDYAARKGFEVTEEYSDRAVSGASLVRTGIQELLEDGVVEAPGRDLAAGIGSSRSYRAQQRRAEELAELDRAKTIFFSNISHEFRTPLTLILDPVAELGEGHGEPTGAAADVDDAGRGGVGAGQQLLHRRPHHAGADGLAALAG